MRNGNLLKSRVSEVCVKRIRVKQGVGVLYHLVPYNDALLGNDWLILIEIKPKTPQLQLSY